MSRYFKTYWLILCLAYPAQLILGICDDGWLPNGLYCYYFSEYNATKADAQANCEVDYADLLYIDDDGENVFIYDNGPEFTRESYWTGYEQVFGTIWRWSASGKAGSYRKWDIGEPDGEGSCARLTPYIQGVWRDWDCDKRLLYICKKFADCDRPVDMPLATFAITPEVTSPNITAVPRGATVTYTCLEGHEYPDESLEQSAICSVGGVWLPDLLNDYPCEPKQCQSPPLFGDTVETNATEFTREFGTLLYYECEPGYWFDQYSLNVTKYLTCDFDKTWHGDTINECSKVYCVRPVTSHARADTPLNSFGTIATYVCDVGYEFPDNTSSKTFDCTDNGWVPSPVPCEELKCEEFSVNNAIPSTDSLAVFTEVIWSCQPGMRYPDTTTRKAMKCQLDESWDRKIHEGCERKRCEGVPPNASATFTHDWNNTNGEVYRFGDMVNYTCIPEWFFSDGLPSRQVFCNEDGEWSPRTVTDCLGEIVEVKQNVQHAAAESEGSATFGSITLTILGILAFVMVFLDCVTIGKHIGKLKENLCGISPKEEKEAIVKHLDSGAVQTA